MKFYYFLVCNIKYKVKSSWVELSSPLDPWVQTSKRPNIKSSCCFPFKIFSHWSIPCIPHCTQIRKRCLYWSLTQNKLQEIVRGLVDSPHEAGLPGPIWLGEFCQKIKGDPSLNQQTGSLNQWFTHRSVRFDGSLIAIPA